MPAKPIAYKPAFEQAEEGEAETIAELIDTMLSISETTFADYGHAVRSVHAKSHGVLDGALEVLPDLPAELAQGLFAAPGRYPVQMRWSATPGDILDDKVSTPRGLAIKVRSVPGPRLPAEGTEADSDTQDFVLVNGPAFLSPKAKSFVKNMKLLAATTDKAEGLKKALSAALRATESALEVVGGKSSTLTSLGGHPATHVLGETFFSQAPILYGRYMAKISVAPVSPALQALQGRKVALSQSDALRAAVQEFFHNHAAEWELRVQLCTDLDTMPIEDASVVWPEEESPYLPVARMTAPAQDSWDPAKIAEIDAGLSFSPWHCLAAHRPLGVINRVRKQVYEASAEFRLSRGRCPAH